MDKLEVWLPSGLEERDAGRVYLLWLGAYRTGRWEMASQVVGVVQLWGH